ncbi:MAG: dihydroxyacetone kinase subunit DhaL [Cellulomonadaceae bacterium]
MSLDVSWAVRWMTFTAHDVHEARDELVELDRQIGDGDHGTNLDRGFGAVATKLEQSEATTVGGVLKVVATTLMSTVGGASGPLYGTAFLRAAKVTDLPELDARAAVALLEGALEGVSARGRSTTGEKTMVDAWAAAVDDAETLAREDVSAGAVLAAAAEGARRGLASTREMVATKGRASYLGERSRGHLDPGAASTAIILAAAARAAR